MLSNIATDPIRNGETPSVLGTLYTMPSLGLTKLNPNKIVCLPSKGKATWKRNTSLFLLHIGAYIAAVAGGYIVFCAWFLEVQKWYNP